MTIPTARRSDEVRAVLEGDVGSELAAIFAALDPFELEADELRRLSRTEAARHEREIEEEVQRIAVEARAQAESQRDAAVTTGRRTADVEAGAIVAQAEADATRIKAAGEERLPGFVADVLARVLEVGS